MRLLKSLFLLIMLLSYSSSSYAHSCREKLISFLKSQGLVQKIQSLKEDTELKRQYNTGNFSAKKIIKELGEIDADLFYKNFTNATEQTVERYFKTIEKEFGYTSFDIELIKKEYPQLFLIGLYHSYDALSFENQKVLIQYFFDSLHNQNFFPLKIKTKRGPLLLTLWRHPEFLKRINELKIKSTVDQGAKKQIQEISSTLMGLKTDLLSKKQVVLNRRMPPIRRMPKDNEALNVAIENIMHRFFQGLDVIYYYQLERDAFEKFLAEGPVDPSFNFDPRRMDLLSQESLLKEISDLFLKNEFQKIDYILAYSPLISSKEKLIAFLEDLFAPFPEYVKEQAILTDLSLKQSKLKFHMDEFSLFDPRTYIEAARIANLDDNAVLKTLNTKYQLNYIAKDLMDILRQHWQQASIETSAEVREKVLFAVQKMLSPLVEKGRKFYLFFFESFFLTMEKISSIYDSTQRGVEFKEIIDTETNTVVSDEEYAKRPKNASIYELDLGEFLTLLNTQFVKLIDGLLEKTDGEKRIEFLSNLSEEISKHPYAYKSYALPIKTLIEQLQGNEETQEL